ncbi:type II toxin-antitoxin system HicB family antitoxin [Kiloniella laminariae]|uniref:Type II toxin-antitoxin system HicB family antitoxin n=1 Tax=Kiloniella laminariae TaxID=454162 RepID=A0ABT4LKP8_9PROT|nr:type II toxin-antitoxin system HicB family antitoxin [Kiloniella laminariae]MCZ4281681.1 type II toxin-antitoxin system HicB family antitoxin [Kiloniella laminariae]
MIEQKRLYPAVMHKDVDSDYNIIIPDLDGCYASGRTIEEVLINAHEAADLMVEELVKAKADVPRASQVEDLSRDTLQGSYMVTLVSVILPSRAKRVQVTIDEAVLEAIDAVSSNRSKFLTDAARAFLSQTIR